MSTEQYDYLLKCIIVGDAAVGKTAIAVRFAEGKFRDDYKVTIGVDFSIKMMNVYGQRVKFQIWDTGGQEQFSYIRPMYYTGASCGLVVFDKTNRTSFNNVDKWIKEVFDNRGKIPLIIAGNKFDLSNHIVSTEEGTNLAKKYNTIYFDTSAKSGRFVDLLFKTLVQIVLDPEFIDKLTKIEEGAETPHIIYNGAYENYNKSANRASAHFQSGNKLEALFSLEDALHWAKKAEYEDGILWAESQIAYITQLLNKDISTQKDIILYCENCAIYYQVRTDGVYSCSKCSGILKKM
ncbi:MAG: Rab family GTPase [Candidatus Hodarchaeota archaeon]